MTTKTRKGAVIAAVAAMAPGVGWALPHPADAASDRAAAPQRQQQEGPGDADSAELYTRLVDVSVDEARRRLAAQDDLNTALGELRALAGDRFAGSWIQHEPDYRGVIRLTGQVADRAAFDAVVAAAPMPIDVRTDAPLSRSELEAEQLRVQAELLQTLPGATTGIHEQSGSINVYVPGRGQASRQRTQTAMPEVRAAAEAPIRVHHDQGRFELQHDYGGNPMSGCTTGFTVWHHGTGQDGVLSAGHCGDGHTYNGYNGDVYPLTRVSVKWNTAVDMAVYTSSHVAVSGQFNTSSSNRLTLNGTMSWLDQQVGDLVCHYGAVSGNSCGFITDHGVTTCDAPPTLGDVNSCDATWVRVESSILECSKGDSGGPWYDNISGIEAFGIHHGGWFNGDGADPGECTAALYNPIDWASDVGAEVLVP